MHKIYKTIILFLLMFLISINNAIAYNYAEAQDPMLTVFKTAVAAATEQKWDIVSLQTKKAIELQRGHLFEADYLSPYINKAINQKDISKTAELFANLVFLSIQEKLKSISNNNFKNFNDSKFRIQIAHKSYMEVLDGNIKKKNKKLTMLISNHFMDALNSIGNPGLFGIGKKEPNPDGYKIAVNNITNNILEAFPNFKRVN